MPKLTCVYSAAPHRNTPSVAHPTPDRIARVHRCTPNGVTVYVETIPKREPSTPTRQEREDAQTVSEYYARRAKTPSQSRGFV